MLRIFCAAIAVCRPRTVKSFAKPSIDFGATISLCLALLVFAQPALAQFTEQKKLVGAGYIGYPYQGQSVALSADGNTAIVGGFQDDSSNNNTNKGAAWVYTRVGILWYQQAKLVPAGTRYQDVSGLGYAVALSADGNTAAVGAYNDNTTSNGHGTGSVYIYTRSGATWSQQAKLGGSDVAGNAQQGSSVALTPDGNTVIFGGPVDNGVGAAWVFTRNNGVWTQQGPKLVGTGSNVGAAQGDINGVALSADGQTAIVGGRGDNPTGVGTSGIGAAWIFSHSNGSWNQQGSKLVGSGASGVTGQGIAVALSGDGNTAFVNGNGAAWAFTRSGSTWTQQGSKLVGSCGGPSASAALSYDGNLAILGMAGCSYFGGVYVFTRGNSTWTQQANSLIGSNVSGYYARQGWSVALSRDTSTVIVGGPCDNNYDISDCFKSVGAAWIFTQNIPAGHVSASSSPNPSQSGQAVTITVKVTVGSGTCSGNGTVTFMDGSTTLGGVALSGGTASLTIASLSEGSHSIDVIYSGDTACGRTVVNGAVTHVVSTQNQLSVSFPSSRTGNAMNLIGPPGGPFWPFSPDIDFSLGHPGKFVLTNKGTTTMNFAVSLPDWLYADPKSGTIAAGASTVVLVTPDPKSITYGQGIYGSQLAFVNTTNGSGNTNFPSALAVRSADSDHGLQQTDLLVPLLPLPPDGPRR